MKLKVKLLSLLQIAESLLFLCWAIAVFEHLPPSMGSIFIRMCAATINQIQKKM